MTGDGELRAQRRGSGASARRIQIAQKNRTAQFDSYVCQGTRHDSRRTHSMLSDAIVIGAWSTVEDLRQGRRAPATAPKNHPSYRDLSVYFTLDTTRDGVNWRY
jgi:hypothetical protein